MHKSLKSFDSKEKLPELSKAYPKLSSRQKTGLFRPKYKKEFL
jgi:hypothetical protein